MSQKHSHSLWQILQTPVIWLHFGQLRQFRGGLPHFMQMNGIYRSSFFFILCRSISSQPAVGIVIFRELRVVFLAVVHGITYCTEVFFT
jgi:hypothetical protein